MERIVLTGSPDAAGSFDLARRLEPLTTELRPSIIVDLSAVCDVHPSVVSVLIRHRRQARRLGGDIRVIEPTAPDARRTLGHIGLIGAER